MTEDSLIGKQLGEYRLEALLGQGGMARVYRAVDVRLKRYAVVKVIDLPFRNDPNYTLRFEREAQAIAQLDHPHIVRLYRFDEQDGWLYMAMQYVEGADLGVVLADYRADGEFIEPDDARRLIGEVCEALDYAHGKGVIHRDVKPANILLDRQGRAILSDFGLALLAEVGTRGEIFGSPHYIAPEQAVSSAKAVPQSDLYAVGVILYEMFTGDVPFRAAEPLDVALLHISEPPPAPRELRPELSPELEAVIQRALAKKPEDRYPTGAALSEALERALKAQSAATLLAPPTGASRQTIPQRVALELAEQPLPPIPAVVATPAPQPVEEPISPEPTTPPRQKPWIYIGATVGLVSAVLSMLVCLALVILPPFMSRLSQAAIVPTGPTATQEAAPLATAQIAKTATAPASAPTSASLTTLATDATPTPLPTPTSTPVSYALLIVRGKDGNSLIVVNQTTNAFPLTPLRLGKGNAALTGAEWGIANLESGACVGAWKAGEAHTLPEGLNCQLVGEQLERKKKDWFGNETFGVYYSEGQVGACNGNQTQCALTVSP